MKPEKLLSFSTHLLLLSFSYFCTRFCSGSRDTITSTTSIKDPATIVSNASSFQLGFFSPANSTNRHVGIWFNNQISPQTIVWVANRDNPLKDSSGIFTISEDGNLVVLDGNHNLLWSTNVSNSATNVSARILDSGNLVLEDSVSKMVIWQSFKNPCDVFLASMEFMTNTRTNEKIQLTSWNNPSDPSMGSFSLGLHVLHNIPEGVVWNGQNTYWRSGPWNGQIFIGIPNMDSTYLSGYTLDIDDQTYYLSATFNEDKNFGYLSLSPQGNVQETYMNFQEKRWRAGWSALQTPCDFYGACGAFGICNPRASPVCRCLRGFNPKHEEEWNRGNWSNGCVRNTPLKCDKSNKTSIEEDGFHVERLVKVPFLAEWVDSFSSIQDCRVKCLGNCSCSAYAYVNGIRCMLWKGDLIDIQKFESGGTDLYLRLPYGDLDHTKDVKGQRGIIIGIVISVTFIIFIVVTYIWCRWKSRKQAEKNRSSMGSKAKIWKLRRDDTIEEDVKLEELPVYDFETLVSATNNFAPSNKLGQGGFGPVYKGKLLNGEEIAVKRLSRVSNQGYEEFLNEVRVISKLQHRNLVQLLGCCIEGEEKTLVYEYMPNLSLDALIFGSPKQKLILDWRKRYNIIDGIARGLLYLHRDSRLRIIHRDLKASNILLDKDLNPKISDFGMARIFGGNEVQANTLRIVGTYGYMSPEYAMRGQFSEKSDVFSFGVLLLEIISGRRNTGFYLENHALNLLEFVWKLRKEDNLIPLIEPTIYKVCWQSEILRCIHVGLLCVQDFINDRPNVSTIISMINSDIVDLPSPKQPGFVSRPQDSNMTSSSQQNLNHFSVNNLTQTTIIPR
ncbi:G-type lectin S-receptor-like serine/threonine-protein kinase SD1-13 isoform X1 [Cucurbita maxima]|uniref:Receptor-like serine/threonine-protein kinase n=2 Tax=Cucurbita maxima TaxID=3661 RepID=A0A6J1KKL0_CUCMA|nr:G-type lectin S-receptor-like serine/threonine-protein kinase SD1-13 isoform X1 [Cucurbita maxima]